MAKKFGFGYNVTPPSENKILLSSLNRACSSLIRDPKAKDNKNVVISVRSFVEGLCWNLFEWAKHKALSKDQVIGLGGRDGLILLSAFIKSIYKWVDRSNPKAYLSGLDKADLYEEIVVGAKALVLKRNLKYDKTKVSLISEGFSVLTKAEKDAQTDLYWFAVEDLIDLIKILAL